MLLGCWSAGVICKLVCIHLYLLSIYLILILLEDCYLYGLRMIILYVNMLIYLFFFLLNIKCEKKTGLIFVMYLINYFIYLYNFKVIYDVTSLTTGRTPVRPVVREPLPFPVLFPVQFLKPWF